MNKLEEAKDKLRKYFPNHTDKSKWNKSEILSLVEWLLQSTLTLDSKIKDGEIVKPVEEMTFNPNGDWEDEAYQYDEEYQNLPTLRECLKERDELKQENERLMMGISEIRELWSLGAVGEKCIELLLKKEI